MTKDIQISARVSQSLSTAVEQIAALQGRSRSWVIEKALERYIETEAAFMDAVKEGLADAEAGRSRPFDDVADAFEARFRPIPSKRKAPRRK